MSDYVNPSYDQASFDQKAAISKDILLNVNKIVTSNDGYWIADFLSQVIRDLDKELEAMKSNIVAGQFQYEADIINSAMKWRHRMLLQQALNLLIKSKESIK